MHIIDNMHHAKLCYYNVPAGDWHIAYILLYASKQVEKLPQVPKEADIKKETA